MFHLTTEISDIDFSRDVTIFNDDRFIVTSGDIQVDVGNEKNHGYHILFRNKDDVISDFHGVLAEDFILDVKNHTLSASFLIDPMAPVIALAQSHPRFSVEMHAIDDCSVNCYDGYEFNYLDDDMLKDCYPYCDDQVNHDVYPTLSLDEVYKEDMELVADQGDEEIAGPVEDQQDQYMEIFE